MPVRPNLVRLLLAVAARLAAMLSYPCGAALAKQLFPAVGAQGATAFRLGLAAPILLAGRRPWRRAHDRGGRRALWGYGLAIGR